MTLPRPEGTPYETWQPRSARIYLGRGRAWVTYTLLAVSILVYVLQVASQLLLGEDLVMLWLMKVPASFVVRWGQWWRLWTPLFVHGGLTHLAFNMYALYLYGPTLERLLGKGWFLALYFTAGLWGNALSAVLNPGFAVGASSAVFGVFAALWLLMRRHREILGLWGQRVMQAMWSLIGVNLLLGFVLPRVDNWGHIGGALGGLAFIALAGPRWRLEPYPFDALDQNEQAGFFLHRVMPLRLRDQRSPLRRALATAALWAVVVGLVLVVGRG